MQKQEVDLPTPAQRALAVRLSELRQIATEFVLLTARAELAFATEQATQIIASANAEDYTAAGHGDLSVDAVLALRETYLVTADALRQLQQSCLPVQALETRRMGF